MAEPGGGRGGRGGAWRGPGSAAGAGRCCRTTRRRRGRWRAAPGGGRGGRRGPRRRWGGPWPARRPCRTPTPSRRPYWRRRGPCCSSPPPPAAPRPSGTCGACCGGATAGSCGTGAWCWPPWCTRRPTTRRPRCTAPAAPTSARPGPGCRAACSTSASGAAGGCWRRGRGTATSTRRSSGAFLPTCGAWRPGSCAPRRTSGSSCRNSAPSRWRTSSAAPSRDGGPIKAAAAARPGTFLGGNRRDSGRGGSRRRPTVGPPPARGPVGLATPLRFNPLRFPPNPRPFAPIASNSPQRRALLSLRRSPNPLRFTPFWGHPNSTPLSLPPF